MITTKEINQIRADLAVIGVGSKLRLAKKMKVDPSMITKYLRTGKITERRLKQIYSFINKNKK